MKRTQSLSQPSSINQDCHHTEMSVNIVGLNFFKQMKRKHKLLNLHHLCTWRGFKSSGSIAQGASATADGPFFGLLWVNIYPSEVKWEQDILVYCVIVSVIWSNLSSTKVFARPEKLEPRVQSCKRLALQHHRILRDATFLHSCIQCLNCSHLDISFTLFASCPNISLHAFVLSVGL